MKMIKKLNILFKLSMPIGLIGLLIAFLYRDSFYHMMSNTHLNMAPGIIFYLGIFLYLVFKQKTEIFKTRPNPAYISGSAILFCVLFMLYISKLSGVLLFEQISLLFMLFGTVIFIFGKSFLKTLFLPILFLIIPTGYFDFILNAISIYLQVFTAIIAGSILNGLGITTILSGPLMYLPHISLYVEQGCNGANHITALMVLAMILGASKSRKAQLFMVFLSFAVGLFLNGIRVTLIGLWSFFYTGDLLHGPGGIFFVTFIFVTGSFVLIIIASNFNDKPFLAKEDERLFESDYNKFIKASFITIAILTSGFFVINYFQPEPQFLKHNFKIFPYYIKGFQGSEMEEKNMDYIIQDEDDVLQRLYVNKTGDSISVYIAYLAKQNQEKEIVNYINSGYYNNSIQVPIVGDLIFNYLHDPLDDNNWGMYFAYIIDGEVYHDPTMAKLATLWTGVSQQRTNGAFIFIKSKSSRQNGPISEITKQFINSLIVEFKKILQS